MPDLGMTSPQDRVFAELYYSPKLHGNQPASTHLFGFPSHSDRGYCVNLAVGKGSPQEHRIMQEYPDAVWKGSLARSGFMFIPAGDIWSEPMRVPPIGPRISMTNFEDGPIRRAVPDAKPVRLGLRLVVANDALVLD